MKYIANFFNFLFNIVFWGIILLTIYLICTQIEYGWVIILFTALLWWNFSYGDGFHWREISNDILLLVVYLFGITIFIGTMLDYFISSFKQKRR